MIRRSGKLEDDLVSSPERDPLLCWRLRRLRTVPGVGSITALTWALEIGDYKVLLQQAGDQLLRAVGHEKGSAAKALRMPLPKQRNRHIQRITGRGHVGDEDSS